MTTPLVVHPAVAPADRDYDQVEVDPWPHIHLNPDQDGTVSVALRRYKGQSAYDRDSRDELAEWTFEVTPPSLVRRALGDTIDRRIDRAIAKLQRRWDRRVADAEAAYIASRRIR